MQRCHTWDNARAELKHYKRREPEKSVLYRIVSSCRDDLPRVWEVNCGLLDHGAARVYCDKCKYSFLVAYSCKKRGICPSCSAKRAVIFAEHLKHNVLKETPNRHIVFSIPKRIRSFFRYDRKLLDILFKSAWSGISENLSLAGSPALVLTVQTAGEALNWNPHLHGALANGVFTSDGCFKPYDSLDLGTIKSTFENHVLAALQKAGLLDDGAVQQILSQTHTGFSVWLGEPFSDSKSALFVARYIERDPISLEKLEIQDDIVTYTTNDGRAHEFDPLEFLALLTSHLPSSYESVTRYYGQYSCRRRGQQAKIEKAKLLQTESSLLSEPIPEPINAPSRHWAGCMKRVLEINPLECPRCKAEMRIVAFLQDANEISKIMKSLNTPPQRKPTPIPRAPPIEEFYQNVAYDILDQTYDD